MKVFVFLFLFFALCLFFPLFYLRMTFLLHHYTTTQHQPKIDPQKKTHPSSIHFHTPSFGQDKTNFFVFSSFQHINHYHYYSPSPLPPSLLPLSFLFSLLLLYILSLPSFLHRHNIAGAVRAGAVQQHG